MKFINLTPHTVRLNDGREFPPSGTIARVSFISSEFDENSICRVKYNEPENLLPPQKDVVYIVSSIVMDHAKDRNDLVAPASGHKNVVRKDGQIYSVPGFQKVVN